MRVCTNFPSFFLFHSSNTLLSIWDHSEAFINLCPDLQVYTIINVWHRSTPSTIVTLLYITAPCYIYIDFVTSLFLCSLSSHFVCTIPITYIYIHKKNVYSLFIFHFTFFLNISFYFYFYFLFIISYFLLLWGSWQVIPSTILAHFYA